jgi:hypothetical protein
MKNKKEILNKTENQQQKSDTYFYDDFDDFIKREGIVIQSQELTKEELAIVKTALKLSKRTSIGFCFYNSQVLTINDETNSIEYWEGYKTELNFPFLHGFNVINGKVIDITRIPDRKKIFGVFDTNIEYTGVKFDKKMIHERIRSGKNCISFLDNWEEDYPILKTKWKK